MVKKKCNNLNYSQLLVHGVKVCVFFFLSPRVFSFIVDYFMSECVVNNEENLWIIKILDSLLMVPEEILRKRKQVRILLYLREYS